MVTSLYASNTNASNNIPIHLILTPSEPKRQSQRQEAATHIMFQTKPANKETTIQWATPKLHQHHHHIHTKTQKNHKHSATSPQHQQPLRNHKTTIETIAGATNRHQNCRRSKIFKN
jgi:hypothetical protein